MGGAFDRAFRFLKKGTLPEDYVPEDYVEGYPTEYDQMRPREWVPEPYKPQPYKPQPWKDVAHRPVPSPHPMDQPEKPEPYRTPRPAEIPPQPQVPPWEQEYPYPPRPPEDDEPTPVDKSFRFLKARLILKNWQQRMTGSDMRLDELAQMPPELQHQIVQGMLESGELDSEMAHRLLAGSGAPPPFESEGESAQPPAPPPAEREEPPNPYEQPAASRRPHEKPRDMPVD